MAVGESRPDRERPADRVDRLEPETLRLVVAFLVERVLHRAAGTGCEAAWDRFYRACEPLFRKLAHRRCRGCWGFDDRVQELWRVMIERIRSYDLDRCSFASWLATVVHNALIDQDRASHELGGLDGEVGCRLPSREVEPPAACELAEVTAMVHSAVRELCSDIPETTYRIIESHWIEEQSYEEIAATLGLLPKQVRDRYHRAVGRLRACLTRLGLDID